jgi:hypothetical protein
MVLTPTLICYECAIPSTVVVVSVPQNRIRIHGRVRPVTDLLAAPRGIEEEIQATAERLLNLATSPVQGRGRDGFSPEPGFFSPGAHRPPE